MATPMELCFLVSGSAPNNRRTMELTQAKARSHAAMVGHQRSKKQHGSLKARKVPSLRSGSQPRWLKAAVHQVTRWHSAADIESFIPSVCQCQMTRSGVVRVNSNKGIPLLMRRSSATAMTPFTREDDRVPEALPLQLSPRVIHKPRNCGPTIILSTTPTEEMRSPIFQLATDLSTSDQNLLQSCASLSILLARPPPSLTIKTQTCSKSLM
jgi:hypothetical protein